MMQDKDVDLKKVLEGAQIVSDWRYLFNVKIIYPDIDYALGPRNTCDHPYYTHHKEWAPPVEVADKWELPALVRDRYADSSGEGMSLCGLFPEISRAWASIDNSLFLWSFETRDAKCQEYSVGAEVICAVGLAESKPVFDQVVQHLLVLATPTELILVGVSCTRTTNKRDPYAELSLLSLPDYTVASDGVIMSCITCTGEGRIFLAGRDGHIYELQYSARSFWRKHCRKVCLTSGLYSVISRWVVPDILTSEAVDPAIEMVFDNERSILYVRTEDMKLELFELDENKGVLRKAAEETNFMKQKDPSSKPYIVAISPISTLESTCLNLVAVLSDGRRMYYGRRFNYEAHLSLDYDNIEISNCLKAVSIRPCPPMMDLSNDSVQASYYSAGSLILSASSPLTSSSLIIVSKEYSAHPSRVGNIGTLVHTERLFGESVTCLPVEGRLLSAADILPLPDTAAILKSLYSMGKRTDFRDTGESLEKAAARLWSRRDLDLQHMLPRRRVIVLSTMGMLELVFNRPIDILRRLLESDSSRAALEHFFCRFGTAEAAGMCLMLAAKIADNEHVIHNSVVDKATEAFEDPRFVGKPQLEGNYRLLNTRTEQDCENAEPVFSGAYEGLCFCTVRLLDPVWTRPFMARSKNCLDSLEMRGRIPIECRLSVRAMEVLENKLRSLERFLRLRKAKRRGLYARLCDSSNPSLGVDDWSMPCDLFRGYSLLFQPSGVVGSNTRQQLPDCPDDLADMEVRASECLRHVLLRSSEALFLLQLLSKHNVSHLVKRFNGSLDLYLLNTSFEKLVCWEDGDILATRLISTLLEYYIDRDDKGIEADIIAELSKGCPSYFKEIKYNYYLGLDRLERASVSSNLNERENLARDAFEFLNRSPLGADLHIICKRFEYLRFYEAVVKLPLQKAQALDPAGHAFNEQIDQAIRERVRAQREQCYEVIFIALRNLNAEATLDPSYRKKYIHQIVQLAVKSSDRKFREYIYQAMMDMSLESELLEYAAGPDLERFLQMNATPLSTKVKCL